MWLALLEYHIATVTTKCSLHNYIHACMLHLPIYHMHAYLYSFMATNYFARCRDESLQPRYSIWQAILFLISVYYILYGNINITILSYISFGKAFVSD